MVSPNRHEPWPPGRPLIPQEVVTDFKRRRCALALSELVCEKGMWGLTVSKLVKRARMARGTFYDLFGGLENATRYAAELGCGRLRAAVEEAAERPRPWADRVGAAIAALLETAEQDPALTELCLVHTRGWVIGEDGRTCEAEPAEALAGLLGEGGERTNSAMAELVAYGILSVIAERLRRKETDTFGALAGELTEIAESQLRTPRGPKIDS